jgi:hypothetical protein
MSIFSDFFDFGALPPPRSAKVEIESNILYIRYLYFGRVPLALPVLNYLAARSKCLSLV